MATQSVIDTKKAEEAILNWLAWCGSDYKLSLDTIKGAVSIRLDEDLAMKVETIMARLKVLNENVFDVIVAWYNNINLNSKGVAEKLGIASSTMFYRKKVGLGYIISFL